MTMFIYDVDAAFIRKRKGSIQRSLKHQESVVKYTNVADGQNNATAEIYSNADDNRTSPAGTLLTIMKMSD